MSKITVLAIFSPLVFICEFKDWHLQWGKRFITDYSPTVARILIILTTDPHETSILMKWWKISTLARLRANFTLHVWRILANFALLLPKSASVSERGNISHFQGAISNARRTFEPIFPHKFPPMTPFFGPKRPPGNQNMARIANALQVTIWL